MLFDSSNPGDLEEVLPLDRLGDYGFVGISAVHFPVVPLFEMAGLPEPDSHLTGDPSLASLAGKFGTPAGVIGAERTSHLSSTRDAHKERVASLLGRMYQIRFRQRQILLELARSLPNRVRGAVAVWNEMNRPLKRVEFRLHTNDGGGGGVLASYPIFVTDLSEKRPFIASNLDRMLEGAPEASYTEDPLFPSPDIARERILNLQAEWVGLFHEALESERRRQLYEVALEHALTGKPIPNAGGDPSPPSPLPFPEPKEVERYSVSGKKVRQDAKWVRLGQWVVNEVAGSAEDVSSQDDKARVVVSALSQIVSEGARPGRGEEWVVRYVEDRRINPGDFNRKALDRIEGAHRAGLLAG